MKYTERQKKRRIDTEYQKLYVEMCLIVAIDIGGSQLCASTIAQV